MTRHARKVDREAVSETLARAFHDDPVMAWVFEDVDNRPEWLRTWMQLNFDAGLTCGHLYSAGNHRAAAIWSPPDVEIFDDVWGRRVAKLLYELLGDAAGPKMGGLVEMTAHHPDEAHFYLMLLGTDPESQGRGFGAALLARVLDRCDAEGLVAYLESSNPTNLPFYERHGFEVKCEVKLGDDGPLVHPMQRAPR